jgi:hypothetical protein
MSWIFLGCAVFGTAVLIIQFILAAVGLDGDDIETNADGSWFFSVLSLKSLVAAVAFFGLGGIASESFGFPGYIAILTGMVAAAFAMVIVAWLVRLLYDLRSDGTVHIENTLGLGAEVYLSIPAHRSGFGKVTVTVQDRTMEYKALTDGEALATGTPVVIVDIAAGDTLAVALPETAKGEEG